MSDGAQLPLFRELLKAHEYLRGKGLSFDLVVMNTYGASYRQELSDALRQVVESGPEQAWLDRPGGVFLLRAELMSREEQTLLQAAARVVLDGARGNLRQQLGHLPAPFDSLPERALHVALSKPAPSDESDASRVATAELEMFNGFGGFADGGREYVIHVSQAAGAIGPRPWANAWPTRGSDSPRRNRVRASPGPKTATTTG